MLKPIDGQRIGRQVFIRARQNAQFGPRGDLARRRDETGGSAVGRQGGIARFIRVLSHVREYHEVFLVGREARDHAVDLEHGHNLDVSGAGAGQETINTEHSNV